jgi:hypothetical protein
MTLFTVRFPDVHIGTHCYTTKSIHESVENVYTDIPTEYDKDISSPPAQLSYIVRTVYQNKGDTSNRIDISAGAQEQTSTRTCAYFLFEMEEEDNPSDFPRIAILDARKKRVVGVLEWQDSDITKRKSYKGHFFHIAHDDTWLVIHVIMYLTNDDEIIEYDFDFGQLLYPSVQHTTGFDKCTFTPYSSSLIGESIWHVLRSSSRFPWFISVAHQDCATHVLR